jgi:H+/Cl- antiporter ClcA
MNAPILADRDAFRFWIATVLTGAGAGLAACVLTELLELVQHVMWGGSGLDLLQPASQAAPWRHLAILFGAGVLVAGGQFLLSRLTSGNGIEITTAIWFFAGRMPALRTLASAVLSVLIVGMGAALGREGAPKQAGAVIANALCDRTRLQDDERRLLVACGAGAGMAAAYGVPLGGALFAVEVLRGALALRFVLPALVTTLVATAVSWVALPDQPTYTIPIYASSVSGTVWALLVGPVIGLVSVAYVRSVAWADKHRPQSWRRWVLPVLALGLLGAASIPFPQLLGNGRDVAQLAFTGHLSPLLLGALLLLRPAATMMCLGVGAPGGLFTPSLAIGALLGGVLGLPWLWISPGVPAGLFALVGATAMLAATTQGPISGVVLMMELTGYARAAILPVLLAVATATLAARLIEARSIYDARLTDAQVQERQRARDHAPVEPGGSPA